MSRVLAFLALVLLIAFFLPWLPDAGVGNGSTMSGFDITYAVVIQARDAMAAGASVGDLMTGETWQIYILLLIPVFGVLTLLLGLSGAGLAAATGFIAGLPVVILVGMGLVEEGTAVFANLEVGGWVSLAASVLLVLLAFVPRRRA